MAGYPQDQQFWADNQGGGEYSYGFNNDQSQNFDFQSFDHTQYDASQYTQSPYPAQPSQPNIFTPQAADDFNVEHPVTDFDEPPLLDELEIYPSRILEKSLAVLNPFHKKGIADDPEYLFRETDIAGPIAFCLGMAACLFVSGNKAQFGYVYGLSIISVLVMFSLISLMCNTTENYVTISAVASILGYSILPIVWLSVIGVFFSLNAPFGMVLAGAAIFLATAASSRIFCLMTGDPHQRYLIAYPCALVYVIFALLVLF